MRLRGQFANRYIMRPCKIKGYKTLKIVQTRHHVYLLSIHITYLKPTKCDEKE